MKQNLFFISVALLGLTACSNDTVLEENISTNQPREIAFTPLTQPTTRAAVQGTTFPTTNTMEVRAYQTTPAGGAGDYFSKTTFAYQYLAGAVDATNNPSYWGGTTPRYWPLGEASLNFFAVSGANVNAADITIADALASSAVNFRKYVENRDDDITNPVGTTYSQTTQSDIMYAFGRQSVGVSENALSFNAVDMQFKHALALVKFQVKAGNAASEAISITSIVVNGAKYTGSLALTNSAAVTATSGDVTTTVSWTPDAAVNNVTVPNSTGIGALVNGTFKPADGGAEGTWACLMIVPGTGNGISNFVINYTLNSNDYSYTYIPSLSNTVAGTVYTYQITMTLNEIQINPTVSGWTGTPTAVAVP